MAKVLRSISAHTSRRGSNAQNASYTDLLDEFDPLADTGGEGHFGTRTRTPIGRPRSAMAFDFNQQKAQHLAASNNSSQTPSPMARQTGPEWEAFYASFSNESLAPSGIKPGDDGAPVPPPKPASVAQTGDGFDEEADFDETMGREGGGGGGGTMEDDREFVRSKTLSPTNVAPRKRHRHGRAQSHVPQSSSSSLRRSHTDHRHKHHHHNHKERKSRSHRSSRRSSKSAAAANEKKGGSSRNSRSSSREGNRLSEKRSPFAKNLRVNPFDDDQDDAVFDLHHEDDGEAGEPGSDGEGRQTSTSSSGRSRRHRTHASMGATPTNSDGFGFGDGGAFPAVPKTPRRSKRGSRGASKSVSATPTNSDPMTADFLGGLRVSASAPKIETSNQRSSFDIGLSPIVDVPETPYLNGNDPDDKPNGDASESESVPATPSTNNFTFTVDSVATPTTNEGDADERRHSSSKERRRPASTRNRASHTSSSSKRHSRKNSSTDANGTSKRHSRPPSMKNSRKERRHARSHTTPADMEEAAELRERYEARKAERRAHKRTESHESEDGNDDHQLSAHGLAHSAHARADSVNTLQREYGLDGRARRVVKEVWSPQKVTMTQVNIWEGDWLMEAHFEFSNYTSSKVPVAIKFMRFNSNHEFLRDGDQPFYPNLEERNIAIVEGKQLNYRFIVVKRRAKVGPKDKLELNYRFGYKRLGRWNMAW